MSNKRKLVDAQFYLANYQDVAASGMSAEAHYLQHGWLEGRYPSALFQWQWEHTAEVVRNFFARSGAYRIVLVIDDIHNESLINRILEISRQGVSILILSRALGVSAHTAASELSVTSLSAFQRLQISGELPSAQIHGEIACVNLSTNEASITLNSLASNSVVHFDTWEVLAKNPFEALEQLFPSLKRVSVVVPSYNYAEYLALRLQSIVDQTYPIYELIVLDDASADSSVLVANDILRATRREWLLDCNAENSGSVFRQWQKGVSLATGEFIWIAEADDAANERFLEVLLSGDTNFTIAACNASVVNGEGQLQHKNYNFRYRPAMKQLMSQAAVQGESLDGSDFVESCLSVENQLLNVSGLLFHADSLRRELLRSLDDLLEFKIAGDWYLYVNLLLHKGTKIKLETSPLNVQRVHARSVSQIDRGQLQIDEIERVHQLVLNTFNSTSLANEQSEYLLIVYHYFNLQPPAELLSC
ncbi:glycosyltransferase family 2 protein [uncultured Umboniibacter sp.]|uniref:glycosyltransferase family 2 protein n=1 Tax=uncultured Umboniibacter sp. TaxID=1798917 RepID=UPI0026194FCA|nr:glycosyltransferase family 2 protein [uncultured Umboniibacter sp.]